MYKVDYRIDLSNPSHIRHILKWLNGWVVETSTSNPIILLRVKYFPI